MPHLVVIAGPNGAGKSTIAPGLLADTLHVQEFVNADVIARGLSAFQPETVAMQAGRIMLKRLKELANNRADFAFETTLASRSFGPWIAGLKQQGYHFSLLFMWLPGVEAATARVQDRVCLGGHDVPEETIRRRFSAGLRNFFDLYMPMANLWRIYDNSESSINLVAAGGSTSKAMILDNGTWEAIKGFSQ